jgi:hypothetical protein
MAILLRGANLFAYRSSSATWVIFNFASLLGSSSVASWVANSFGKIFVKMLTHLHVIVKHLWCWRICKGEVEPWRKEAKPGSGCCPRGTVTPCSVAPPPLGRCLPGLGSAQWRRRGTVTDDVHHHCLGGAPLGVVRCHRCFLPEAGEPVLEWRGSPPWAPPCHVRCITPFIQRVGFQGCWLGGHRHPCPVTNG